MPSFPIPSPARRASYSLLALFLAVGILLAATGCGSKTTPSPTTGAVSGDSVATVNGESIRQSELNVELNRLHGQEVLQSLIAEKLIAQEAKKQSITVEDREVNERLADVKISPQYAAMMRSRAMTDAELGSHIRRLLVMQKLILKEISETEKLRVYDQYKEGLEQAHIFHILVDGTKKDDATKIVGLLKSGKDFGALARQYSKDEGSGAQGGDLGWMPRSAPLDPAFSKLAFSLPVNQVSAPVKTKFGWHIIKVVGRKRTYDELKTDIQDRLVAARQGQYIERLRVKAEIKTKFDTPTRGASPSASRATGIPVSPDQITPPAGGASSAPKAP